MPDRTKYTKNTMPHLRMSCQLRRSTEIDDLDINSTHSKTHRQHDQCTRNNTKASREQAKWRRRGTGLFTPPQYDIQLKAATRNDLLEFVKSYSPYQTASEASSCNYQDSHQSSLPSLSASRINPSTCVERRTNKNYKLFQNQ